MSFCFFFLKVVETFVGVWMSKSVNLSSSSPTPNNNDNLTFKRNKTLTVFWKIRSWKIFEIMRRSSFYDGKHGDATGLSCLCGIFCGRIKKRCQRQIIYFSRRSVIKVFARTPQTGFLRSPITVEIIIIGTIRSSCEAGKKCKARYASVGNVVKLNIGGRIWNSSLSVWYALHGRSKVLMMTTWIDTLIFDMEVI